MSERAAVAWQAFLRAVRQQRVSFASVITVTVLLVGVFHAPPKAVLVGCGGAFLGLLGWACWKELRN